MKCVIKFGSGWGSRVARAIVEVRLEDPAFDVSNLASRDGCEVYCGSSYMEIIVEDEAEEKILFEEGIDVDRQLQEGAVEIINGIKVRNAGRFFSEDAPAGATWFYCKDEFEDWNDQSIPIEIGNAFDSTKLELAFKWFEDGDGDKHFMFSEVYYDGVRIIDGFDGDLGREGEVGYHWTCSKQGRKKTVEFR